MEDRSKEIEIVFERINDDLESQYKGKIVAIEIDSGDYFIGDNEIEAYEKAVKRYPGKKFVFKRIGFGSTHFVGAL